MSTHDPLRQIQNAARFVAGWVTPGGTAARVVVFDASGKELFAAAVPPGSSDLVERLREVPETVAGWSFVGRVAKFDGKPVTVAASRVRLLRALAESDSSLTAKELTDLAFDKQTDVANTRFHIRNLKEELAKAFPSFEGSILEGDNDGYRLLLR